MFDTLPDRILPSKELSATGGKAAAPAARAALLSGVVTRVEGGACLIDAGGVPHRARRAAGCLVEPAPGDRVLVATIEDGSAFVLSVLERAGQGPTVLSAPGDLSLRAATGKVDVVARDGVDIVSPGEVSVVSAGVAIQAEEGRLSIGALTVIGQRLVAEIPAVQAALQTVDTVIERLSQKIQRSYRRVEELDRLQAKQVRYQVEKTMHLSAETTLVTATDVVKLDGEHVHIG